MIQLFISTFFFGTWAFCVFLVLADALYTWHYILDNMSLKFGGHKRNDKLCFRNLQASDGGLKILHHLFHMFQVKGCSCVDVHEL